MTKRTYEPVVANMDVEFSIGALVSCGGTNVNGFVHLLPPFCLHFIHSPYNCPKFFLSSYANKSLMFLDLLSKQSSI